MMYGLSSAKRLGAATNNWHILRLTLVCARHLDSEYIQQREHTIGYKSPLSIDLSRSILVAYIFTLNTLFILWHLPTLKGWCMLPETTFLLAGISFHVRSTPFNNTSKTLFFRKSWDANNLGCFSMPSPVSHRTGWLRERINIILVEAFL